jgi:hypothetical protein
MDGWMRRKEMIMKEYQKRRVAIIFAIIHIASAAPAAAVNNKMRNKLKKDAEMCFKKMFELS